MSLLALALVLTAAVCHATWNVFVKKVNAGPEFVWLFSLVTGVVYLPLALYVLIVEAPTLGWVEFGIMAGSAVLHLGYFLLLQAGYRNGDLSLVYPTARATGPFLSVILAVVILGENISAQAGVGALIIVVGIVNLTGGFKKRPKNVTTSLAFGLGTGAFIGGYTIWDAYAVTALMVPPLLLDYGIGMLRAAMLTPYSLRRLDKVKALWRDHKTAVIAVGIFSPMAYILVLYAMTLAPVIYVAPLRETSVLLTVLVGSLLLGEGHLKSRLTWSTVILLGVSLLVTG